MLEGVRLVATALAAGLELTLVLYDPERLASTPGGQALLPHLTTHPHSYPATAQVVAHAAATVTPQGIVAVAAIPTLPARPGLLLLLDGVQDPGNVGTLLRSAEAAGCGLVVCAPGTADPYSPKVVRGAMGAHGWLPLAVADDWGAVAALVAPRGTLYAATGDGTHAYYAVDWRQAGGIIIGSEAHGISDAARALATGTVAIPMAGRAESLNAAVAGSVIMFEGMRQRMQP